MNKATNVKKQILASQIAYKRTQNNEVQLEKALAKFFNKLKKEVLNALDEYWKDYQMLQGHIDLITAPVHEAHKEYYELLTLYIKREYRLGSAEAKRLVRLANSKQKVASKSMRMPVRAIIKKDNDLFGTLPSAEERLLNRTFTASERTLSRVDSQINQIITDGYRSGKGINDVANSLNQRFDQLTSWESKRIARTEIHNSHNTAVMDTYQELGVEYTMWIAAEDERTRDSHLEINGEIIPMGSEYSNGLKYPGDTDGDIEEWINCRCSNAPFVVPYGFMAPSFSPFREDDLIKVETKPPVNEPQPVNEDFGGEQLNADDLKAKLNEDDYNRFQKYAKDIEKANEQLSRLSADDPRRIPLEHKIKSRIKALNRLEQKALNPIVEKPKQTYPYKTETPQEAVKIKEEMGAKNVYSEVARNKHTYEVYEFEGFSVAMDRELMYSKNVATVDEIKTHMNSLPSQLRNGAKIRMSNIMDLEKAGVYNVDTHEIELFNNGTRVVNLSEHNIGFKGMKKETILDTLTHEAGHSYDLKNYDIFTNKGNIASKDVWGKIVKADAKLYKYKDPVSGRMRTPKKFTTGYASESWYKASRSGNYDVKTRQYCEDFAESTKLYLNPTTHNKFVKDFPNRAKFLEEHYGKPKFRRYIVHTIKEKAVR